MRILLTLPMIVISTGIALAGPAGRDRRMDDYLAIWADDRNVSPSTVARLYARRVTYYGQPMSNAAVFRDKSAFARQWPRRAYAVVPGSVSNDCTPAVPTCRVTAVLRWRRADASGDRIEHGTNSVALVLVRQDGRLKIATESGTPVR